MSGERAYLCNGCGQIITLDALDDLRCYLCGSGEVETVDADPLPGGPEAYAIIKPPSPPRAKGSEDVGGDGWVWSR